MATSYFDRSLGFQIKKVLRYISLYGFSRTFIKVRGQLHMRRKIDCESKYWKNPGCRGEEHPDRFVAIVGCGNFAYSAIAYYLAKRSRRFLRAAMDLSTERARSLCKDFGGAYATGDMQDVLDDPAIKLVYIASNHASHAEYAIQCIEVGKHVHIEKPHVVTQEQLDRLLEAQANNPGVDIYLGFNRPRSEHFRRIRSALDGQPGPTMINWFIAGHQIPDDHWYFKEEEGGRVLGNLCHWTDLTLQMVGVKNAFPCEVIPVLHKGSKSDFCVGLKFADLSVAGITFSAKGHTFEGVREVLQAHRGDALVKLRDFEESVIEIVEKRKRFKTFYREHGHGANIVASLDGVSQHQSSAAVDPLYLQATSKLFLGIRKAFDELKPIVIELE